MSQSVCIISTRAPYSGQSAREALDAALVCASYDIPTALLLMGEGVFQLLQGQDSRHIPRKNISAMLQALPLYGIDSIYVDERSLLERGIEASQLCQSVTMLSQGELPTFIRQHSKVLNF